MKTKEYLDENVVNISKKFTSTLFLPSKIELDLIDLAKKGYPNEIVGFLLGVNRKITEIYSVENVAKEKERRFQINDIDYIKVENFALDKKLDILGIFHSHPDYPAIPSKHDLYYAQPVFSYLIISIDGVGFSLIHSWKLDKNKFIQEPIKIINT